MPISSAHFSAVSVATVPVVLEFLPERPTNTTLISPSKPTGQLCGYYDAINQRVELYVVDASGLRYKRVG